MLLRTTVEILRKLTEKIPRCPQNSQTYMVFLVTAQRCYKLDVRSLRRKYKYIKSNHSQLQFKIFENSFTCWLQLFRSIVSTVRKNTISHWRNSCRFSIFKIEINCIPLWLNFLIILRILRVTQSQLSKIFPLAVCNC